MYYKLSAAAALVIFLLSAALTSAQTIDLKGNWKFAIDRADRGVQEKWFQKSLNDQIKLPGSMNENLKGDDITLETKWTGSIYDSSFYFNPRLAKYRQPGNIHIPFWLSPLKHYVGPAWYQKEVEVPASMNGKRLVLYLERSHIETRLWLDGQEVGLQNSLVAPHEFDLGALTPGRHLITLRIDNRIKDINVGPDSHSITDHTQGNWNGVIGKMELRAGEKIFVEDVQIYPDVKNRKARVELLLINQQSSKFFGKVLISARSFNSTTTDQTKVVSASVLVKPDSTQRLVIELPFESTMQTWDEFNPALYQLSISLTGKKALVEKKEIQFGMRDFKIEGNRFLVNGRPVFLRGTVNNCEFPLTGYPDMDVAGWERIFAIAKAHGLNHMRFHSWCPPEAAFIAADKIGFYLQPEGPSWTNHGPKLGLGQPVDKYLYEETDRMMKHYGNYASFTMLSAGNEPAGNQVKYLNEFVNYWKKKDSRRVYTGMSVGGSWPVVPNAEFQVRGGVRGLDWARRPESLSDYSAGIARFSVPFIAHEMGQWCAFPNFAEIKKYTGAYRAKNFELFMQDLKDRGMEDQAQAFHLASGKLQALCYKNEIEKALRTPGYGGFQLLGLQDFPGQGTALVGLLDAFWDEKGYITTKEFARFCNSTVPLARLPKFVFSSTEQFEAGIDIFHSGPVALDRPVLTWTIKDESGKVFGEGEFRPEKIENANGIPVGKITLSLNSVEKAAKLNLEVAVNGTNCVNDWDFWVYPETVQSKSSGIYYTTALDDKAKAILNKGGKVFLNAAGKVIKGKEVAMHFLPVFWNTSWFKMRPPHVTGMLIQEDSPAFADFPTDFHSDLQWWEIANRSQVMVLEDFPVGFKPLVQPIDTWFLNRRLGLIYEAAVGKGKLIVSSADLGPDLKDKPAAKQLYNSLLNYMSSAKFNPSTQVSFDVVKDVFVSPSKEEVKNYTKDSPDELKPNSNQNKI
ncbi:sugar-binding domain-containing protein [Pedobacter sp. SYSU D00535]|uniref:exo-beta-1,4-galactosidase n=1 Tax=Pedobacter sp. SYSU D00535 TaxID=2810308 RepID=UPI001A96B175|nr:sugar-binding domain-containing protein [Pedobacter sp. SYSU D00535]